MNNEISIPHGNWKTSLTKYDFDKLSKFPFNFHGVIHLKKNDGGIDWQKLTSALAKFFTFKPTIAFEDTTDPNDHHIHYLIALSKNQIPHHSKHLQTNYDAIQGTNTDIFPKVHLMGGYNRHLQPIRTTVSRTLRYASRQTHNEQISEVYRSNHLIGDIVSNSLSAPKQKLVTEKLNAPCRETDNGAFIVPTRAELTPQHDPNETYRDLPNEVAVPRSGNA